MRTSWRRFAFLAMAMAIVAACGSDKSTGPGDTVSLAGQYTLTSFKEGNNDLSQATSGTLALTATNYTVNITFQGDAAPPIADQGTYTATSNGSFSQTSSSSGAQSTGTYTLVNGLLTLNVTEQGMAISQTWQKQ